LVDHARRQEAMLAVLQVERGTLLRLRDEGRIDDEVMRTLQRELDLTESRMHSGSLLFH
jgi:Arc/MetJ family transcription regulator